MNCKYIITILLFCWGVFASLTADDAKANEYFNRARAYEQEGRFQKAAGEYRGARLMAKSHTLKGNALIACARNYRKCGLYGEEFDCLELLLKEHLSEVNFALIVEREFEIGDLYFRGHRDAPVSFLPFLTRDDRTMEVYEAALSHAPCSPKGPISRLRLARLYIDAGVVSRAMHHLRMIHTLHPGTKAAHNALLEQINILYQQSRNGDGDNARSRQALKLMDEFEKQYPDSPEMPWVRERGKDILNYMAKRLHAVGSYYNRIGEKATAGRYLGEVVKKYPNTEQANASGELLAEIDSNFTLSSPAKVYKRPPVPLLKGQFPSEHSPILIVPEGSGNRFLLPVRDLKRSKVTPVKPEHTDIEVKDAEM